MREDDEGGIDWKEDGDKIRVAWSSVYGNGSFLFFFQAEDGIRGLVRSRGLGDVYKRQDQTRPSADLMTLADRRRNDRLSPFRNCRLHNSPPIDDFTRHYLKMQAIVSMGLYVGG